MKGLVISGSTFLDKKERHRAVSETMFINVSSQGKGWINAIQKYYNSSAASNANILTLLIVSCQH